MPNVKVFDMAGKEVGSIELSDVIFGAEINGAVLHAAVRAYLLNQRQGTQSTLTRSEVSGGGRKPWKQKGTGHARQGSTRSPQWVHGGIALGPKPRSYAVSMNKKARKLAICSALSAKVAAGQLILIDGLNMAEVKTKTFKSFIDTFEAGKALVITPEVNKNVVLSARNIPGVKTTFSGVISVYDILKADKLLVDKEAALKIQEVYAK